MQDWVKISLFSGAAFIASFVIFFNIAWFTSTYNDKTVTETISADDQVQLDLMRNYLKNNLDEFSPDEDFASIDRDQIREFSQFLSAEPHVTGEARDKVLIEYIRDTWTSQGLDSVEVSTYNLRLSRPDPVRDNVITLSSDEVSEFFISSNRESNDNLNDDFVDAYLAYTPAGDVEGEVVYVNFARVEDFELISDPNEDEYYTNTTGKICIARYGKLFRGNKVMNGETYGCIGMILYSDPMEVAPLGTDDDDVYPFSQFLPGSGIQRGSTNPSDGDPSTPNWPSLEKAFRYEDEELYLPGIPAQPIGYDDATDILKHLTGKDCPPDWLGGIDPAVVDYNLGGAFKPSCGSNCIARLQTFNRLETSENSNVIGIIRGEIEPDRYVMMGNHRDAWGFGAIDAVSGGSQLLEVTRILGAKLQTGWRPRRSMVFLSWGAEEFGLIGSRELAEDYMVKLMERSVAYINIDVCTSGPVFNGAATPMLQDKVVKTLKEIPDPANPDQSYYDRWQDWQQITDPGAVPTVPLPGAGSDHANFIFYLGVPIVDVTFGPDTVKFPELIGNGYPTYHTGLETYQVLDFVDPEFETHEVCALISLSLGRDLADSLILDFEPQEYHDLMVQSMQGFADGEVMDQLDNLDVDIGSVQEQIDRFGVSVTTWKATAAASNRLNDPLLARMMNDQISKLDRLFILNNGLPDRADVRHAIISPSMFNSYGAASFPGISDLLFSIGELEDGSPDQDIQIRKLHMHVSDLMIVIKAASDYLLDLHVIEAPSL